jgi:MGT family glycosyltransferase
MARFLFTTATVDGHVNPVLPILRKMVEGGHEVVFITGRGYRQKIEAAGAQFYPFPPEIDSSLGPIQDFDPQYTQLKGIAQTKHMLKHIFLDACEAERQIIESVLQQFPADLLVSDIAVFAPYFMSEMGGPPSVVVSFVPLALPSRDTAPFGLGILPGNNWFTKLRNRVLNFIGHRILLRDVTQYANKIRREWRLGPLNGPFLRSMFELPDMVICLTTPEFEYPRSDLPENVYFVGPIFPISSTDFEPPQWWDDLSRSDPVILVNQGTVAIDLDDLVAPTIKAFKDQPALIVAVPVEKDQMGELPDNIRAEPFIPFDQLLPHVDVMVTNGGYGGTQMALAQGIPLVVAGETEDKMEVAARVEWAGAGVNLHKQRPTPEEVRRAVSEVLTNPRYRENAKRIQADFAKYDALTRTCELLESMV